MPLLTAQQHITKSIEQYPSLFLASTYEDSKFLVLSHLFETIGNGVHGWKGFRKYCASKGGEPSMPPAHYYDGTKLAIGFTQTITFGQQQMPQYSAQTFHGVPVDQKDQYPSVVLWEDHSPRTRSAPYPNFQAKYSLIHEIKDHLSKLDISWIEAAQWFYSECKTYFQGNCGDYHVAYPKDSDHKTISTLKDFIKRLEHDKKPNMSTLEFHEHISIAYGHPYDGDPDHFLATRWIKERKRIMQFIDDTLDMLAAAHAAHPSQKRKKSAPKIK